MHYVRNRCKSVIRFSWERELTFRISISKDRNSIILHRSATDIVRACWENRAPCIIWTSTIVHRSNIIAAKQGCINLHFVVVLLFVFLVDDLGLVAIVEVGASEGGAHSQRFLQLRVRLKAATNTALWEAMASRHTQQTHCWRLFIGRKEINRPPAVLWARPLRPWRAHDAQPRSKSFAAGCGICRIDDNTLTSTQNVSLHHKQASFTHCKTSHVHVHVVLMRLTEENGTSKTALSSYKMMQTRYILYKSMWHIHLNRSTNTHFEYCHTSSKVWISGGNSLSSCLGSRHSWSSSNQLSIVCRNFKFSSVSLIAWIVQMRQVQEQLNPTRMYRYAAVWQYGVRHKIATD